MTAVDLDEQPLDEPEKSPRVMRVMRAIAATAWVSVKSSGSRVRPRRVPMPVEDESQLVAAQARYSWANPTRCRTGGERYKPWEAHCPGGRPSAAGGWGGCPTRCSPHPSPSVYQLRVVVRGVRPLIWRRAVDPAETTIAGLHAVLQTAFGWTGTHLPPFVVQGRDHGIGYVGGPSVDADPRMVRLGDLGLRPTERFTYH